MENVDTERNYKMVDGHLIEVYKTGMEISPEDDSILGGQSSSEDQYRAEESKSDGQSKSRKQPYRQNSPDIITTLGKISLRVADSVFNYVRDNNRVPTEGPGCHSVDRAVKAYDQEEALRAMNMKKDKKGNNKGAKPGRFRNVVVSGPKRSPRK